MQLVAQHYPIEPVNASLVRTFNNDVFRIDTADRSYALKIYGAGRFTADEVRWEQRLAHELTGAGLRVAADVPLTVGRLSRNAVRPRGGATLRAGGVGSRR